MVNFIPQFRDLKRLILGLRVTSKKYYDHTNVSATNISPETLSNCFHETKSIIDTMISMSLISPRLRPLSLPPIRTDLRTTPSIVKKLDSNGISTLSARQIDSMVSTLTRYDYGADNAFNINVWLYHLAKRGDIRNLGTLSRLIGYFLDTNDLQMANFWLSYMDKNEIKPDRTILYLILRSMAYRFRKNKALNKEEALHKTRVTLQYMQQKGVMADAKIWNLVLQCMPFDFCQNAVLREMSWLKIEVDPESWGILADRIIDKRAKDMPEILKKDLDGLEGSAGDACRNEVRRRSISSLLLQKLPNNNNVRTAWKLVTESTDFSTETMNIFLKSFARRRIPSWQFGILSHFSDTKWNIETWDLFFECVAFAHINKGSCALFGTLFKQREREGIPLTSRSKYLTRRMRLLASKERLDLVDFGTTGWNQLIEGLKWEDFGEPKDPSLLINIGFCDEEPTLPSTIVSINEEAIKKTMRPVHWEQVADYLKNNGNKEA